MKIDLREIPAVYINLKQHTEKNKLIKNLLEQCGFKTIIRFDGFYCKENPSTGCAVSQTNALQEIDPPFIIFEDDCLLHNFDPVIEIPDDADTVYLGITQWARYFNFSGPFLHYESISENVVRVYNMLATHSILYLNKEYISMCCRIGNHSTKLGIPLDVGFAEVQRYFNVYAINDPMFKQGGYNENVTSCKVTDIGIDISNATDFFDDVKYNLNRFQEYKDLNDVQSMYYPLKII